MNTSSLSILVIRSQIFTMANPAAFIVLPRYTCSAFLFLPRGQSWGSHAFSPVQKCQFPLQHKLSIVNTGCWHIRNQLNTTTKRRHLPKKHIRKKPIIMAFTVNQESGGHSGRALQQYSKRSPLLHSNILQLLHYQRRNWYPHHITTTKTPNLLREHINNDRQEREEDIGLPIASKDDVRSAGEEGEEEELGNSISTLSRNVDKLLPPSPFIDGVHRLSSRSPSAGGETAVEESATSHVLASVTHGILIQYKIY